jgi:hypothetical protein
VAEISTLEPFIQPVGKLKKLFCIQGMAVAQMKKLQIRVNSHNMAQHTSNITGA